MTLKEYPDPKTQVIIMTHEGPFGSSTTLNKQFYNNETCYHAGSPALKQLILQNQQRVLCNIHGHTHDGASIQNMWKPSEPLNIINPGALSQGEFSEMTIKYVVGENRWKISEVTKIFI